jgi:hypothetical protein
MTLLHASTAHQAMLAATRSRCVTVLRAACSVNAYTARDTVVFMLLLLSAQRRS